jgi:hypothetical protein
MMLAGARNPGVGFHIRYIRLFSRLLYPQKYNFERSTVLRPRQKSSMTQLEAAYRYGTPPSEATMRALDNVREVYGIRRIVFNESERIIRVEFDASRFKEPVVVGLLRRTGLDLGELLVPA